MRFPWWVWPAAVVALWTAIWAIAVATGHWRIGHAEETVATFIRMLRI
jgi:hypothetical protein